MVTHKKSGAIHEATRHFITSLSQEQADARKCAQVVRGHWTVENNIHWLRDAVGGEDRCRSRDPNTACALALLRTALLAPVRKAGYTSLTQANEAFAHQLRGALAILRQRLA